MTNILTKNNFLKIQNNISVMAVAICKQVLMVNEVICMLMTKTQVGQNRDFTVS